MGLVNVGVHSFVAIVALDDTGQEVVHCILDANGSGNRADILQELSFLRVRDQSWVLRPRARYMLYF